MHPHPCKTQIQLVGALVDGELEEEEMEEEAQVYESVKLISLTQDFPFQGCPPTCGGRAQSAGLARVLAALRGLAPTMSPQQRHGLTKVLRSSSCVLNCTDYNALFIEPHRYPCS